MDIETILLDVRDRVTESRGIVDGLAINQHHAEDAIKEIKEDLRIVTTDVTNLKLAGERITVKLGLVPKIFMGLATLISIVSIIISLLS